MESQPPYFTPTPPPGYFPGLDPEVKRAKAKRSLVKLDWIGRVGVAVCLLQFIACATALTLSLTGTPVILDYPWIFVLHLTAMLVAFSCIGALAVFILRLMYLHRVTGRKADTSTFLKALHRKWLPAVGFVLLLGLFWSALILMSTAQFTNIIKKDGKYYHADSHSSVPLKPATEAEFRDSNLPISRMATHVWTAFSWGAFAAWATAAFIGLRYKEEETDSLSKDSSLQADHERVKPSSSI